MQDDYERQRDVDQSAGYWDEPNRDLIKPTENFLIFSPGAGPKFSGAAFIDTLGVNYPGFLTAMRGSGAVHTAIMSFSTCR